MTRKGSEVRVLYGPPENPYGTRVFYEAGNQETAG